jgi:hypothetical protein
MLQIEFCGGIFTQDNANYWTDENIGKFEELAAALPDSPESILKAKTRFLNAVENIKTALERHRNPSENQKRAAQNLESIGNSLKIGR